MPQTEKDGEEQRRRTRADPPKRARCRFSLRIRAEPGRTAVSNVTAWANIAFRQRSSGIYTASVMRFDNVRFERDSAVHTMNG